MAVCRKVWIHMTDFGFRDKKGLTRICADDADYGLEAQGGEDFGGLGADAGVGVGFGEEDGIVLADDEDGGKREPPAGFGGVVVAEAGVVEGDVDEDRLEVTAVIRGDGVGDAELLGDGGTGVGEEREGQGVLLEGEAVLAGGLGRDGDEESAASAEVGLELAPGLELGDAVGVPAAAEEVDDDGAEGEEIGGADGFAGEGVLEGEGRSVCPGL